MKELGIYLVGCPKIARKVETYFENLWTLASLDHTTHTTTVSDKQWQVDRQVPCWSHFLDSKLRCRYETNLISSLRCWVYISRSLHQVSGYSYHDLVLIIYASRALYALRFKYDNLEVDQFVVFVI